MKLNNPQKKKVIVLGKGDLAIKVSNWFQENKKYDLILIVPVVPEPKWTGSLREWAKKNQIPLIESGHYKDISGVKYSNWEIDLAFSVFYDKIIEKWFIEKCKKILNLHNSSLPKYRGVNPINWALKNNEKEHGVTIHQIALEIDSGPIVSQVKYSIYPSFEEVRDVYQKSLDYGFLLFKKTMPILEKIEPRYQDESLVTYYNKKDKEALGERKDFTKDKSNNNL